MRRRWLIVIWFVLILLMAVGLLVWWGVPSVLHFEPADGAVNVPAGAPLRLEFSRPMRSGSVEGHLSTDPPIPGSFTSQDGGLVFTPDSPWPSGTEVRVRLAPGSRAAGWLSLPLLVEQRWSFTTGNPQLLYLYPSIGQAQLYQLDPETRQRQQLTSIQGEVLDFSVVANGNLVVFTATQGEQTTIYALNRLTSVLRELVACEQALCRLARISPSGDWLAYERTELTAGPNPALPQVWLEHLAAGTPPALVDPDSPQSEQPAWSLSGLLIYYNSGQQAFIWFDPQSGQRGRFANQTGMDGDWDPAGETFVAAEIMLSPIPSPNPLPDLEPTQSSHLMRYSRLQGGSQDLTGADDLEDTTPVFSPDGNMLAFARKYLTLQRWTPGRQLWFMNADGSSARQVTQDPQYNHYGFAWSPAGDILAYVRFNQTVFTEPPEIWLVRVDGTGKWRVETGGYAPHWVP